uniref:Cytochrome b5 domain-containing protein 1 n=1 Tax=Cynoglossus semilaevis TaxID=244447 RepID=A0A3P8UY81_CYNSE
MDTPKYFTPAEVAAHNTAEDLWVSFLGKVCNLTPLMNQFKGDFTLNRCGNKCLTYFPFNLSDFIPVLKHVDPLTNCVRYYTPRGRFVHTPPSGPHSDWAGDIGQPWWKDQQYEVGRLTTKARWIRVLNTLTSQEQRLQVCSEETLDVILERYLRYNSHARSYTWKYNAACLDMNKTLDENNVPDDDMELEELRLDRDLFVPALLLHFNDDLTEG